jgi:hypothetical protein
MAGYHLIDTTVANLNEEAVEPSNQTEWHAKKVNKACHEIFAITYFNKL